ncbi:unnamed protein product [Rotaria sordida]|uniref:Translation elongation factor EFG/EF2 domain-containing protein n=1 Tax=Rotaria sordida TaxID=392033 RepID=A0A818YPM1_9BILA|nr:unnamed protein product [Rotaria sordida]CAF3757642.1 unnamed protein product [Rotaria sordida]CAF3804276.1 unnamed protein product [Rotaria sordida]
MSFSGLPDNIEKSEVASLQNGKAYTDVLAEENVRGVRFNIYDITLYSDAIHRADGQFIPATCRVIYAPMLIDKLRLFVPVYLCEIEYPKVVLVLTADLHSNIGDQAFSQCIFDH